MPPRNTTTGGVLEQTIVPALKAAKFEVEGQQLVGFRPGGGRHFVDAIATEVSGRKILISLKWQQVSGTAEQKVPFEVISLAEIIMDSAGAFDKAYLVLGGEGWTLRDYYVKGGLAKHLIHAEKVQIVTLEGFMALANRGKL